eukprot:CAMPEP_0175129898 /NCGR_PEP_ID=MMETSP0087-20121206/5722_1 /TAXON_ID=136419 /ORGANISM="Unknown Unknown, Strain D1" /LENGTH=327 /DNA_ID=CAMNT_0016412087 /DNA_START=56 /DNA_END=1039 /DNA_ORIENTATION=+
MYDGGLAATAYGVVSVAMGFVNKAMLDAFPYSNYLLLLQMVGTASLLAGLSSRQMLSMLPSGRIDFSQSKAKELFPVVVLYNANVACALAGLAHLSVPMYSTLKRLTPITVLVCKSLFFTKQAPPWKISLAVLVTVSGTIIAGWGDVSFDLSGYTFALVSCVLQSSYLLLVEKTGVEKGLLSVEILYYNSVLSTPVLFVLVLFTEMGTGTPVLLSKITSFDFSFIVLLLVFLTIGCLLNFTLFVCVTTNSALTTTIVGVLKGVATTFLGILFTSYKGSSTNLLGISVNTVGGAWYSYEKYQISQKKRASCVPLTEPEATNSNAAGSV